MKSHRAGYSLLEVLVAFAILMMVLAVVLPGKIENLARLNAGEAGFLAQDYALSRLDRFAVAEWPSDRATVVLTETYLDWTVRVSVEPAQAESVLDTPKAKDDSQLLLLSVQVFGAGLAQPLAQARRYLVVPDPGNPPP